jgi:hypothetical protein
MVAQGNLLTSSIPFLEDFFFSFFLKDVPYFALVLAAGD